MSVIPLKKQVAERVVYRLQRKMDEELYHLLLGQCLKRIRKFAEEFDSDADPMVLARAVEHDSLQDQPAFCLIIAVQGIKVVGHLLATADWYFGKRYVFVHQLDLRGVGFTPEEARAHYDILKTWAKSMGASGIRAGAGTDAHVRLYKSWFGFAPFRTIMKGDL